MTLSRDIAGYGVLVMSLALAGAAWSRQTEPAATGKSYSTTVAVSPEARVKPYTGYLWIPDGVQTVRAVYGSEMGKTYPGQEGCFKDQRVLDFAARMQFAVYCGCVLDLRAKTSDDPYSGNGEVVLKSLDQFATETNHPELKTSPLIIAGYSGGGYNASHWAFWRPQRLFAVFGERGGDLLTRFWYPWKMIRGAGTVPTILLPGGSDPIVPFGFLAPHAMKVRAAHGRMVLAIQPGGTHTPIYRYGFMGLEESFIEALVGLRMGSSYDPMAGCSSLSPLPEAQGWLGDNVTKEIAAFGSYTRNRATASWLPTQGFASTWRSFVQACPESLIQPAAIRRLPAILPAPFKTSPSSNLTLSGRGRVVVASRRIKTDLGTPLRGCTVSPFTPRDTLWWRSIRKKGHFNAVRYLAYTGAWPDTSGFELTLEKQLALLDEAVSQSAAAGVYLLISNYSSCCGGFSVEQNKTFWDAVAPRYKNYTHVLYEMQNDPVAWSPPYDSAAVAFQVQMFSRIRSLAPQTHIVCWSFSSANVPFKPEIDKAPEITYENASVGFQPYRDDPMRLTASQMSHPLLATEIDAGPTRAISLIAGVDSTTPASVLLRERIKMCEGFKIGWFWLGTDLDDKDFTEMGVFWPSELPDGVTPGVPLKGLYPGAATRPAPLIASDRLMRQAQGTEFFDTQGRNVKVGLTRSTEHRRMSIRVLVAVRSASAVKNSD